jgi:hypothetical protein
MSKYGVQRPSFARKSSRRKEGSKEGRDNNLAEDVNLALSRRLEKKRGADE